MATITHKTSRRAVLGALAGVPIATFAMQAEPAFAEAICTAEWDQALAEYREAHAESEAAWERSLEAHDAWCDALPERPACFTDYHISSDQSLEEIAAFVRNHSRPEGWDEHIARVLSDVQAYRAARAEATERFNIATLDEAAEATNPRHFAAREAVMAIPAPTIAALLVKIEIAAVSLNDEHAESMLADARRLLSGQA